MTQSPHPMARSGDARGNCVRTPGLIETFLLALLATLLGNPRAGLRLLLRQTAAAPALAATRPSHAWTADLWDDEGQDYVAWTAAAADAPGFWAPVRGWHADCDPSILYVIGPPPNRGMRALPRPHPAQRPGTARAPPRAERRRMSAGAHPPGRFATPSGAAHARPYCSDIET